MLTTPINYPAYLPNPLREGHSLQPVQPFGRTALASGRARQRRLFTSVPTNGTWDYVFTDAQAALFEAWFRYALGDGVEWFNATRKTPLGVIPLVCRFTAMYTGPTLFGRDRWKYSCPIEVIERPMISHEWSLFPDYLLGSDIIDLAANREWPLR